MAKAFCGQEVVSNIRSNFSPGQAALPDSTAFARRSRPSPEHPLSSGNQDVRSPPPRPQAHPLSPHWSMGSHEKRKSVPSPGGFHRCPCQAIRCAEPQHGRGRSRRGGVVAERGMLTSTLCTPCVGHPLVGVSLPSSTAPRPICVTPLCALAGIGDRAAGLSAASECAPFSLATGGSLRFRDSSSVSSASFRLDVTVTPSVGCATSRCESSIGRSYLPRVALARS